MVWLWIGVVIEACLVIGCWVWALYYGDWLVMMMPFVSAVPIGFVVLLFNVACSDHEVDTTQRLAYSTNLVDIGDALGSHSVHGGFFIGVSGGGTRTLYTYYVQNHDGSYSLHTLGAAGVKIFEDSSTPRVECFHKYVSRINGHLSSWWQSKIGTDETEYGCTSREIFVPPGSISRSFALGPAK